MPDLKELHTKLEDKNAEILKLVATSYGLGDVGSLEPSKLHQLEEEVEEIIEQHEEALLEGDTVEEWRALDERLAKTEVGQLLQARFEICDQILDLQEDDTPEGAEMTAADVPMLAEVADDGSCTVELGSAGEHAEMRIRDESADDPRDPIRVRTRVGIEPRDDVGVGQCLVVAAGSRRPDSGDLFFEEIRTMASCDLGGAV